VLVCPPPQAESRDDASFPIAAEAGFISSRPPGK